MLSLAQSLSHLFSLPFFLSLAHALLHAQTTDGEQTNGKGQKNIEDQDEGKREKKEEEEEEEEEEGAEGQGEWEGEIGRRGQDEEGW